MGYTELYAFNRTNAEGLREPEIAFLPPSAHLTPAVLIVLRHWAGE